MPNPSASDPVRIVYIEDGVVIGIDDSTPIAVAGDLTVVQPPYQSDAGGRVRVSQLNTLGDYKPLVNDLSFFYDTVEIGGGSSNWNYNSAWFDLSVSSDGDAVIKQTYQRHPYSSGKSHYPEFTFMYFEPDDDVIKRAGYFRSSAIAPYTAGFDGIYLESSNGTVKLKIDRIGINMVTIEQAAWDNQTAADNIDWDNFNVFFIDFLWLGGTGVRLFNIQDGVPVLLHTYVHAGTTDSTMIRSPNLPMRYEMRSTGGNGFFNPICAQVSSEGEVSPTGAVRSVNMGSTKCDANAVGTCYALVGIQLQSDHEDTAIDILKLSVSATTNDDFLWELRLNPTVAGTFTMSPVADSSIEYAVGDTTNTVTGGYIIKSGYGQGNSAVNDVSESARRLGMAIDGTSDMLLLCVTPLGANLDIYGAMTFRERV